MNRGVAAAPMIEKTSALERWFATSAAAGSVRPTYLNSDACDPADLPDALDDVLCPITATAEHHQRDDRELAVTPKDGVDRASVPGPLVRV